VGTPYHDPIVVNDNYWKNITAVRSGIIIPDDPGSYNLRYDAQDGSGNIAETYYVTVIVKDLVPPEVELRGENPLTVDVNTTFIDPGVTASDKYYQNLTTVRTGVPTMNTLGTFTITYTVIDGAKNATVVSRTVNVVDRIAPAIELLGKNPVKANRFSPFIDPGVKLNDNFYSDDALRPSLVVDSTGLAMDIPGLYFVTYSVSDPSGNKAKSIRRLIQVSNTVTGLNEMDNQSGLSIYPNPGNGQFMITTPAFVQLKEIKVIDILGRTVKRQPYKTGQTDISDLQSGVYYLIAEDEKGDHYSSKLVIE
jgi:hypothetical protein